MATSTAAPATRKKPWIMELYGSALGKKYVMAITGVIGLGFVIAHMIGNFKIYMGADSINYYGEWLRDGLGYPALPHTVTLWIMRLTLIGALVLHVHAAFALTVMNRRAKGIGYQSRQHYVAADFAGRSMRWTGVIVLLYIGYHLADLTWGWVNPDYVRGDVYGNMIASLEVAWVAALYIVATLALGVHLFHGTWSMFQSLGLNNRTFNRYRRALAVAVAVAITAGNLSFPILIGSGVVDDDRPERTVLSEDHG